MAVDADPTVRLLAHAAFGAAGYRVSIVAAADAALEQATRDRPDLLLLDATLPDRNGLAICQTLRAAPWAGYLPVLVMLGRDDTAAAQLAYQAGATDFVVKPVDWMRLRDQVPFLLRAGAEQRHLAAVAERYVLAVRGTGDGVWDWDLRTDQVSYSPRWQEMLGYNADDLGQEPAGWLDRIHPDDLPLVRAEIDAHLRGDADNLSAEYRMRAANGEYRWMLCRGLATRDQQGKAYRLAGAQTDISQRKRAEDRLLQDALHDALTGLPNRILFLDRVAHCISVAQRRNDYVFAVGFIDLDRFKTVNDTLGHLHGDRLLCEIGIRLKQHLRSADTLARIGGDEFTVLFNDVNDLASLTHTIERIREEIAKPFLLDDHPMAITASLGVTLSTAGYTRPDDMLRDADIAMYRAKAAGKNHYQIFDSAMHDQVLNMMRLEAELRGALAKKELRVHYQPIVAMDGNCIAGFEALIRWQHPERGLLCPAQFLGVAEDTGLILPLGQWLLREAVRQLAAWRRDLPELATATVSVNLSSREFAQPNLLDLVDQVLHDAGLPGTALQLELTESVLMQNAECAKQTLDALQRRGVTLSIDDFGTGHSSFRYLHQFPFAALKIDRSFVRSIDRNPRGLAIVKTIVTLAHNLGLEVVAEGGETASEVAQLRAIGCEFSQGYAYARPLAPEQIGALVGSCDTRSGPGLPQSHPRRAVLHESLSRD